MSDQVTDKLATQIHLAKLNEAKAMTAVEISQYKEKIKALLHREDAVLVAHYYTDSILQELAEETGGCISDSLEMARFGNKHSASTLVVAGVKFMGETAKILNPEKRILMPTLEATCSLDLGCDIDDFAPFCDEHNDHTVVVYANTSAQVKARADWVVTSSIALNVVEHLADQGKKIIWAPDRHLGNYISKETGADMLMWDSACIVHEEFKAKGILDMKLLYPGAALLVHPESPIEVTDVADVVGSTTQLINAACKLPNDTFIVATDKAIFYKMHQMAPDKTFIAAPTAGRSATCVSCAHCPWMAMNGLKNLKNTLEYGINEVVVDQHIAQQAMVPLTRMLDFAASIKNL